jgi:Xaa-Pro aminopeptidase
MEKQDNRVGNETSKFSEFPREEFIARYHRALQLMGYAGLDGMVITSPTNIRFFAGGPLTDLFMDTYNIFFLILPGSDTQEPALVMSTGREGAASTSWITDRRFWTYGETGSLMEHGEAYKLVWETIKDKGMAGATIGMEFGSGTRPGMSFREFDSFSAGLPNTKIVDGASVIWSCRRIKSRLEIEKIREACRITSLGFETGFRSLQSGMTEQELERIIRGSYFQEGAGKSGFLAVMAGGERMIWADALASEKTIQENDLVMLDGGCTVAGYHADMSRMASVGTPSNEAMKLYKAAVAANDAVINTIKDGVRISEVCLAGEKILEEHGVGHLRVFGGGATGHGIGLNLKEPPDLRIDSEEFLKAGMTLAIEPAITDVPGWSVANAFFILEQDVLVTENGCELLTPMTKELWIV